MGEYVLVPTDINMAGNCHDIDKKFVIQLATAGGRQGPL
jgi:hypothetical protein